MFTASPARDQPRSRAILRRCTDVSGPAGVIGSEQGGREFDPFRLLMHGATCMASDVRDRRGRPRQTRTFPNANRDWKTEMVRASFAHPVL